MNALLAISCSSGIDMVQARREFILYLSISVLLLAFDRTYAIFSHGVSSLSMTLMFLPVLVGGIFWVSLRGFFKARLRGHRLYRLLTFLFHSSIAFLVNGMLVKGILDIAGTSSNYILLFWVLSALLAGMSVLILYIIFNDRKFRHKSR